MKMEKSASQFQFFSECCFIFVQLIEFKKISQVSLWEKSIYFFKLLGSKIWRSCHALHSSISSHGRDSCVYAYLAPYVRIHYANDMGLLLWFSGSPGSNNLERRALYFCSIEGRHIFGWKHTKLEFKLWLQCMGSSKGCPSLIKFLIRFMFKYCSTCST